jgi:hypothetical protein
MLAMNNSMHTIWENTYLETCRMVDNSSSYRKKFEKSLLNIK